MQEVVGGHIQGVSDQTEQLAADHMFTALGSGQPVTVGAPNHVRKFGLRQASFLTHVADAAANLAGAAVPVFALLLASGGWCWFVGGTTVDGSIRGWRRIRWRLRRRGHSLSVVQPQSESLAHHPPP